VSPGSPAVSSSFQSVSLCVIEALTGPG
jgi:hypothetical protein